MSAAKSGGWLFLVLYILGLFGGCTLLAGGVNMDWGPAFAFWTVLLVPLKMLNDRLKKMKWPMEFVTWTIVGLITMNLIWLGIAR